MTSRTSRWIGKSQVSGYILGLWLCATNAAALEISDGWARATVPGQTVGAAYLTITSPKRAQLLAVKTSVAKTVEIHSTSMQEGIMRMRQLKLLELPASETVTLAPMGIHLMLLGLKGPLKEGDEIALELIVSENKKKKTFKTAITVRALTQ